MGYLNRKIDHLVSNIYKKYCVGEPRFLNKKAIHAEMSGILMDYLVNCYHKNAQDFLKQLISDLNKVTNQLQVPLTIVKQSLGDQYRIDLATQTLTTELEDFFQNSYQTIFRGLRNVIKKKQKLAAFKKKYKLDEVSVSTGSSGELMPANLCQSEYDSNLSEEENEELYDEIELTI